MDKGQFAAFHNVWEFVKATDWKYLLSNAEAFTKVFQSSVIGFGGVGAFYLFWRRRQTKPCIVLENDLTYKREGEILWLHITCKIRNVANVPAKIALAKFSAQWVFPFDEIVKYCFETAETADSTEVTWPRLGNTQKIKFPKPLVIELRDEYSLHVDIVLKGDDAKVEIVRLYTFLSETQSESSVWSSISFHEIH